jgi:protein-disulfide isomerase
MSEAIASSTAFAEPIGTSRRIALIVLCVLGLYSSLLSTVAFYRESQSGGRVPPSAKELGKLVWLGPGKPPADQPIGERKVIKGEERRAFISTRSFGSLFGQPVAIAWLAWFASVLAALLFVRRMPPRLQDSISAHIFSSSVIALSASFYVAFWMHSRKTFCGPCAASWIFTFAIFGLSAQGESPPIRTVLTRVFDDLRMLALRPIYVLFLAGIPMTFVFGAMWLGHRAIASAQPQWRSKVEFLQWLSRQPRVTVTADDARAPVVLVKFHDYQCPPCRQTFLAYASILAKYESSTPSTLKVISKDFPLDPDCNPLITKPIHPLACRAAAAVRLARRNGKDRALEEWLYRNQEQLSRESIGRAARDVGGVTNFETLYPKEKIAMREDISLAKSLSVRGTPTFFLNGVQLMPVSPDLLEAAIDSELARIRRMSGATQGQ